MLIINLFERNMPITCRQRLRKADAKVTIIPKTTTQKYYLMFIYEALIVCPGKNSYFWLSKRFQAFISTQHAKKNHSGCLSGNFATFL